MDLNQMLQQTGAVGAISRELGVDSETARAGASALLPSILSGLKNPVTAQETETSGSAFPGLGGLGGLLGTLGSLGGGSLLDNVTANEPTQIDKGNQILGQIFGSKDGSRAVAATAAGESGVEPSLLKKMLPILAMVAAGYVMKRAGQGGSSDRDPAAETSASSAQPEASGSGDILGELIGAAGKFLGR